MFVCQVSCPLKSKFRIVIGICKLDPIIESIGPDANGFSFQLLLLSRF